VAHPITRRHNPSTAVDGPLGNGPYCAFDNRGDRAVSEPVQLGRQSGVDPSCRRRGIKGDTEAPFGSGSPRSPAVVLLPQFCAT
jgi:hypothetical protein